MDFTEDIKNGAIFIYPTDTIYGLGCDATNSESVQLIKKCLNRFFTQIFHYGRDELKRKRSFYQ